MKYQISICRMQEKKISGLQRSKTTLTIEKSRLPLKQTDYRSKENKFERYTAKIPTAQTFLLRQRSLPPSLKTNTKTALKKNSIRFLVEVLPISHTYFIELVINPT